MCGACFSCIAFFANMRARFGLRNFSSSHVAKSHARLFSTYNINYNFYYDATIDQTATNSYWGTTNASEIDEKIYGYWDDINLGKVVYEPFAMIPFNPFRGDVDGNGEIEMRDAILAFQVVCNFPNLNIEKKSDVNGDGKIGLEEVIYIMQEVSGLRQ